MQKKKDYRRERMLTAHQIKGAYGSFKQALHIATRLIQTEKFYPQSQIRKHLILDMLDKRREYKPLKIRGITL